MKIIQTAATCVCMFAAVSTASADPAYPSRAITWIVPFAAGGPTDGISRHIAKRVSAELDQAIIIENVGGAGGTLGAAKASRSAPDAYNFFVGHVGTMAAAPTLYKKLQYSPQKDFVPVFRFPDTPMLLLSYKGSKYPNVAALIEAAKTKPGAINIATAGVGSSSHLAAAHFAAKAGINVSFVAYKGTGPAMSDLMAGHVDGMFDQSNTSLPQIKGGKIVGLALTSSERMPQFPGIPTLTETVLPGFEASTWYGLYARTGTPQFAIDKLNKAYMAAMKDTEFRKFLSEQGIQILPESKTSPKTLGEFTASEIGKWRTVITEAGIEAQ